MCACAAQWDRAARYDFLGPVSRSFAYVYLSFADGMLLHWQIATAIYFLIAIGSLVAYAPFLVLKIPLVGHKILCIPAKTAFDRQGKLRRVLNRKTAYEKWKKELKKVKEDDHHQDQPRQRHADAQAFQA